MYDEKYNVNLCMSMQSTKLWVSQALGTHTKFQMEIPIISTISAIHKFWESILDSLQNVSETLILNYHKQGNGHNLMGILANPTRIICNILVS